MSECVKKESDKRLLSDLVLSGTVQLNQDSVDEVYDVVRENIMAELGERGCRYSEAKRFLKQCTWKEYVKLITDTVEDAAGKAAGDNTGWADDIRLKNQLFALKSVLDI